MVDTPLSALPSAQTAAPQMPNPLDQLRDIHLPEPISWWPPAPGWWLLALSVCALLGWLLTWLYRRYRANSYRREALHQLQQLQSDSDPQEQLQALFILLKQTANCAYPNRYPSSLTIDAFVEFLKFSCHKAVFNDMHTDLQVLLYGKQQSDQAVDLERLFKDAQVWIKKHMLEDQLELGDPC
jgi:hypothetical protein